jgi:hypothetical protein
VHQGGVRQTMSRDKELFEALTSDTVKRAEEMCASLSTTLGLERRGQTTYYQGAISDMSASASRFTKVTVAESGRARNLTVISEKPLSESRKALLVFRTGPGQDMKYLGVHKDSRAGNRQDDEDKNLFFAQFDILQDVRNKR